MSAKTCRSFSSCAAMEGGARSKLRPREACDGTMAALCLCSCSQARKTPLVLARVLKADSLFSRTLFFALVPLVERFL